MNCCNNKTEEIKENIAESIHDMQSENTTPTNTTTTLNPWKAATLVVSTALIFTLTFGVLWMTGVVQIAGMNNSMAMKNEVGTPMEKDTTVLPSVRPLSVPLPIVWGDIGTKML